ncbi:MAG TPA: 3D domain-containing protein, partial [Verrucomicrobiae bacterium]|nr:3D domain-containing protein [Verrucomicrobiae bacterium]
EITGSEILRESRSEIIANNPQQAVPVSRGERPANLKVAAEIVVEASAYTFTGHNTATGVPPRVGLIAVDPRVIPLGTKLYVEGYGPAIAADTGGGIKGYKIDVFFNTLKDCLNWGRKRVKIYILQA